MRDIGKNIRQARLAKAMTQDDLAERIHTTRQTVSHYETGRSRSDADPLLGLAGVLEVPAETLLYGPDRGSGPPRRQVTLFLAVLLVWTLIQAVRLFLKKQ